MDNRIFQIFDELKRRKVIRVIPVYAAAAFVLLELVDIIAEPFGLPDWTIKLVIVLLAVGLVVSVILSWIYDVTPEGVKKTKPVKEIRAKETPSTSNSWKIATYISLVVIVILIIIQIIGGGQRIGKFEDIEKSIAILPFENLGVEDNYASLVEAIPIALIMELQNIENFILRSRESTLKYKDSKMISTDIGNELNVNFLISGYLQQQDKNVLARITLTRTDTDEIIWNGSYEEELQNIFEVQDDISKQVALSLKESFVSLEERPTENQDAWLAFLTGLDHYWKDNTEGELGLAIKYLEKAVEYDPDFVLAHAKLSSANGWFYHFFYDRNQERLNKVIESLENAKTLDPENGDVILAESIYYYILHDYDKALERFNQTRNQVYDKTELNITFASLLRRQMKMKKALEYFLKVVEGDPQNVIGWIEVAETYTLLRDYDEAAKYYKQIVLRGGMFLEQNLINEIYLYLLWEEGTEKSNKALDEAKSFTAGHVLSLLEHYDYRIKVVEGKYDEAVKIVSQHRNNSSLDNQFIYKPWNLYIADAYFLKGSQEQATMYYDSARIHLEEKIEATPEDSRYHSSLGIAYAGLGRKKEAIERGLAGTSLMPTDKDFYRGIFRLEDLARIYTMVGEYNLALEQLDNLLSMPSLMSVNLLKKDPVWKPLWDLPEFQELIAKYSE